MRLRNSKREAVYGRRKERRPQRVPLMEPSGARDFCSAEEEGVRPAVLAKTIHGAEAASPL